MLSSAKSRLRIGIVAGEPSGDLLAAHLVSAVKAELPHAEFIGIAGPRMRAAGVEALFPMEKLAVMGLAEVLRHYREIVGIRARLRDALLKDPPQLFIGVDSPDFNLDLELSLRRHGIRTVHYVSPTIWAWRRRRISKIAKAAEHMLVLFPFEEPLYQEAGIPVTYVGHPLADVIPQVPDRPAMRSRMGIPPDARVVALLPGSRRSELERMADLFVATAQAIRERLPGVRFLVPLANQVTRQLFEEALYRHEGNEQLNMTLMFGHAHDALTAADAVVVASGTASLETALYKRPMVITYKISPLTWWLVRGKGYLPYVGLPNILAGKFLVPEFLQDKATPDNLAQALLDQLADKRHVEQLEQEFTRIHESLRQDNARTAARAVMGMLEQGA